MFDFASYVNQTKSSTSNGLNQDATIAALSDGYDLNGNETDDGTRQFAYDVENRLTGVTNSSAATTVSYAYDPTGRLQQEQSTVSGSTATTQFVYAGDKLVVEYSAGALVQRYVHGAGTDDPIVWYAGATTANRNWLHTDNQGTIIATSTASTVTPYTYGAYGEPNTWGGSRFRYTGQIILPASGLYYYKARVYDPVAGRFLQTDTVGYKDDLDLYEYVADDPVNKTDPTGQNAWQVALGAGEVVAGAVGTVVGAAATAGGAAATAGTAGVGLPLTGPEMVAAGTLTVASAGFVGVGVYNIQQGLKPDGAPTSEARGHRGGQGQGERGETASPDKPGKHTKPDPNKPGNTIVNRPGAKPYSRPARQGEVGYKDKSAPPVPTIPRGKKKE